MKSTQFRARNALDKGKTQLPSVIGSCDSKHGNVVLPAGPSVPDPGYPDPTYKVGYQQFRILDNERPRFVDGEGRILKVSVWYPVDPQMVSRINPPHAQYDGGFLLPGDFIPDDEVLDDITSGNLSGVPPSMPSSVAFDGVNLPVSGKNRFPLVVVSPSATIPIWTAALGFCELAASHGMIVIAVEALIGDGWRTRLGFGPVADPSNLENRTDDIQFIIDVMTAPQRWTDNDLLDPLMNYSADYPRSPNNFPSLVAMRRSIKECSIGIQTLSAGGSAAILYTSRRDSRVCALALTHATTSAVSPIQLARVKLPVMFNTGTLDTVVPTIPFGRDDYLNIGTADKDKYWIETIGATHFDSITCAAADGLFRASAAYMTGFPAALSNAFANIYDSLCLNQSDISSDSVGFIANRYSVAMFKVYLSQNENYRKFLSLGDAQQNHFPIIYHTSDTTSVVVSSTRKSAPKSEPYGFINPETGEFFEITTF